MSDIQELQQQGDVKAKELDLEIIKQEIKLKKWDALNSAIVLPQIISKWASKFTGSSE